MIRSLVPILTLPGLLTAEISFNADVRPIITKNCMACHGPDEEDQKGDFHLDTYEAATEKNKEGRAGIVPGHPEQSEIIKRVTSDDPAEVMPPPDHGHSLSEKEIETLKQWIREGAPYEKHWSLQKPTQPSVPQSTHPSPRNAVDHFVAKHLESLSLEPSPEADPRVLLRRLSLDLTGLPPTLEEVRAFAADPSEENYQDAIQRYLNSPAFGEHWAAMWLDIARYADTVGYSGDETRDIWPWRDWVIDAFNNNMPFDEFTIHQIAGDLLPDATEQQILATAFNRNTLTNNEGGTSKEEFRTAAVKDRISTTVNAWMGLTMRCAECHTHKYDPISMEEYYRFYAFFNQTEDNNQRDERPRIDIMPKGRENEIAQTKKKIAELEQKRLTEPGPWSPINPSEIVSEGGASHQVKEDQSILFTGKNPEYDTYLISSDIDAGVTGLRLDILPSRVHNDNFGRGPEGAMVLSHIVVTVTDPENGTTVQKIAQADADFSQPNYHVKNIIGDKPHKNGWAAKHPSEGYRKSRYALFEFAEPLPAGKMTIKLVHKSMWPRLNIGRLILSTTQVEKLVAKHKKKTLDPLGREIAALKKKLISPVRVPIMRDQDKKRDTHMMARGSFLQPTKKVEAGVPAEFDFWPEGAPKNRLGVAQWIVSPENPLTARVATNRIWARLFGLGIVETEEDFGMQGLPPSHPKLLDWLALNYQSGWDTKRLIKLIVSSHTYRQSAKADSLRLEKDPRNVHLSRGPRFRLRAEVVRDSTLAVAGLLSDRMYGPPVYPPNPIKRYVNAFTGGMEWVVSEGEDRHRRAVYTFLKRSSPHPLFETFDMATREVCNLRRIRTNTPLQSFMTLNDVAFIEAAQSLARIMAAHSQKLDEQIAHGIERALLRPGSPAQIETLKDLYFEAVAEYSGSPEEAQKFGGTAPIPDGSNIENIAALTLVCNVILNHDAFLTK